MYVIKLNNKAIVVSSNLSTEELNTFEDLTLAQRIALEAHYKMKKGLLLTIFLFKEAKLKEGPTFDVNWSTSNLKKVFSSIC
jgi:hypothetical protein